MLTEIFISVEKKNPHFSRILVDEKSSEENLASLLSVVFMVSNALEVRRKINEVGEINFL